MSQSEAEPDTDEVGEERAERLDPENRPDAAEVDNTDRTFDAEVGAFTDSEDYDAEARRFEPEETAPSDDTDESAEDAPDA